MFGRWSARRVLRQRGAGGLVRDARTRVDSAGDLALVPRFRRGGVPEWLKGADCKSAGVRLRWFESNPLHQVDFVQIQVLSDHRRAKLSVA